jgi:SAM-dependent methyltransferase
MGSRLVPYFPPVDTERFAPDPDARRRAREELGLPQDATVVGSVGNINPQKGQPLFVEAAAQLRESHPDTRFAILGASYDTHTEYEQRVRERASELGLDVVIRDPGSRVAELAAAFDVFWLTSEPRSEGTPTVLEEAMALGIPAVATDVGAVAEVVENGTTGYVVPPLDAGAIAAATRRLLDGRVAEMGEASRARALAEFTAGRSADVHVEAFELALRHRRSRNAAALLPSRDGRPERPSLVRELAVCPACRSALEWGEAGATCTACSREYPVVDGVPVLIAEKESEGLKADQAEFFDEHTDEEFETTRPHGTPALYSWFLGLKFERSVDQLPEVVDGATALTVCGGSGLDAEYLARAGAHVIASDISLGAAQRTAERARRHGLHIEPVVAAVEALPFADRAVDLVYVHDGLHHLEDPSDGVAEMARVTRDALSLTEPARAAITAAAVKVNLAEHVEEAGNIVARMTIPEVSDQLRAEGFEIVGTRRYAMLYRQEPGPVMRLLSRPSIWPLTRAAYRAGDRLMGRFGNKIAVQARRGGV